MLSLFRDSAFMTDPNEGQEAVATCMKKRGWEYTPPDLGDFDSEDLMAETMDNQLFDTEFRTTFGYGVSTRYDDDGTLKEGAPGSEFVVQGNMEDPNQEYVSKLSTEEQARYYTDLFGADPTQMALPGASDETPAGGTTADPNSDPNSDPNGGDGGSDLDTGIDDGSGQNAGDLSSIDDAFSKSCSAEALPVQGESMTRVNELFNKLGEATQAAGLEDDDTLAAKHPELREAEEAWSECMGRNGHDFESVNEPSESMSEEFEKLTGTAMVAPALVPSGDGAEPPADDANPDPLPATTTVSSDSEVNSDSAGAGEGSVFTEDFDPLSGFDPAAIDLDELHELQETELKLAADDHECQASTYRPVYIEVRMAAEEKVLDDNADIVAELQKTLAVDEASSKADEKESSNEGEG
jgi:hypothetical protein